MLRRRALSWFGVLATGIGAGLAGCASRPPAERGGSATDAQARAGTAERQAPRQAERNDVALFAMGLLDTRYRWGGRGPATGFDCSGLVSHVFEQAIGLKVQGSSAELGQKVRPVAADALQPGDLVFFNTRGSPNSHVGIYLGDSKFVHAPRTRTLVRIDSLDDPAYARRYDGARRILSSTLS